MTSTDDIRDAAQRGLDRAHTLLADAIDAKLEWSFRTTLTNALRRDDAKKRAEGWEDVETIATYVLERTSPAEQAAQVRIEREENPKRTGITFGEGTIWTYAGKVEDPERETLNDQIDRYAASLKREREVTAQLQGSLTLRDSRIRSVRARLGARIIALTNSVQALSESYEDSQRDLTSCRSYANLRDREAGELRSQAADAREEITRLTAALADAEQSETAWHRIAEEYRAEAVHSERLLTTIAGEAESLNVDLAVGEVTASATRTRVQNIHGLAVSVEVCRGT